MSSKLNNEQKDIYPEISKGPLGKPNSNYQQKPKAEGKDKSVKIWPWIIFILLLLALFFWLITSTAVV